MFVQAELDYKSHGRNKGHYRGQISLIHVSKFSTRQDNMSSVVAVIPRTFVMSCNVCKLCFYSFLLPPLALFHLNHVLFRMLSKCCEGLSHL